jgi:hypothetical protein
MLVYNGYQTVFNIGTVAIFVSELHRTGTKPSTLNLKP